jgi:hypothetical protein
VISAVAPLILQTNSVSEVLVVVALLSAYELAIAREKCQYVVKKISEERTISESIDRAVVSFYVKDTDRSIVFENLLGYIQAGKEVRSKYCPNMLEQFVADHVNDQLSFKLAIASKFNCMSNPKVLSFKSRQTLDEFPVQ